MFKRIKIIRNVNERNDVIEVHERDIVNLHSEDFFVVNNEKNNFPIVEIKIGGELHNKALHISNDYIPHIIQDILGEVCIFFTKKNKL